MFFGMPGAVIIQALAITQELFPGDIGWMDLFQDNRPVFWFDLAGAAFDAGSFAGKSFGAVFGSAIDISASIGGVMQESQNAAML